MLFGEIVEPSTRAFIDDDFQDSDLTESVPEYKGNLECPTRIDKLIFIESKSIVNIIKRCLLNSVEPQVVVENGKISVYGVENVYYVLYEPPLTMQNQLNAGELVEVLSEWIKNSKEIYALTSSPLASYQQKNYDRADCVIRVLSNGSLNNFGYLPLEVPNLVTGLGAGVLSYCIFNEISCSMFITYFDDSSLISYNSHPLISLCKKLAIELNDSSLKKVLTPSNNLYM